MSSADQLDRLKEVLGQDAQAMEALKGYVEVSVSPEALRRAAEKLKAAGFDHVKSVTAIDYPAKKQIKVIYHVSSMLDEGLAKQVVGLAASVDRDNPVLPSLSSIWVSAEFQEREVYEFFGVKFEGHPDLRPLLLTPVVAALKPLRKDFQVKEEGDYLESDFDTFTKTKRWT